jgi:hypothetical protein
MLPQLLSSHWLSCGTGSVTWRGKSEGPMDQQEERIDQRQKKGRVEWGTGQTRFASSLKMMACLGSQDMLFPFHHKFGKPLFLREYQRPAYHYCSYLTKRFDVIYSCLTYIIMPQGPRLAAFLRPLGLIWFSICCNSLSPLASTTILILPHLQCTGRL